MPAFPDPEWFLALARLMEGQGEVFRRLGYAEVRFAIRIMDENGEHTQALTGLEINGYSLTRAVSLNETAAFDPDFVICGRASVWRGLLDTIRREGRPQLHQTLNALALMGEELWLESDDQLREDKFYRFNQTLQELFNLSAKLPN